MAVSRNLTHRRGQHGIHHLQPWWPEARRLTAWQIAHWYASVTAARVRHGKPPNEPGVNEMREMLERTYRSGRFGPHLRKRTREAGPLGDRIERAGSVRSLRVP
jgi:hypothetical protein